MKPTSRLFLLVGILGCAAAASGGFLLGGGPRSSAPFPPATQPVVVAGNLHVTPASAPEAAKFQPHKTLFSSAPPHAETSAQPQPSFSKATNDEVVPAARTPAASTAAEPAPPPANHRLRMSAAAQAPLHYPVVMQELPADILNARPGVAAAVNSVRENFIAAVGGTGQNPADPAYQTRWIQGVAAAEDQLRSAVGWDVYNSLQAAAVYAQKAKP